MYANAFEDYQALSWAKAWFEGMTPKINICFWILLKDKILTPDNLMKRGMNLVSRCYLCKEVEESVNHLTIHYSYTKRLWEMICGLSDLVWVSLLTIQDFFKGWKYPSRNTLIMKLWDFILPFLCWGVWKERNDRVFRGMETNSV